LYDMGSAFGGRTRDKSQFPLQGTHFALFRSMSQPTRAKHPGSEETGTTTGSEGRRFEVYRLGSIRFDP